MCFAQGQGNQAHHSGDGGGEDGADAIARPMGRRQLNGHPLTAAFVHRFHHDDGIVHHNPRQGNNANHRRERKGNLTEEEAQEGAN